MSTEGDYQAQIAALQAQVNSLQTDSNLYRTLFNHSLDAMVISIEGVIVDANQAWLTLFGYTREEVIGASPLKFVHSDHYALAQSQIKQSQQTPYAVFGQHKNGQVLQLRVLGTNQTNAQGQSVRFSIVRDVTSQVQTDRARREQKAFAAALRDSVAALNSSDSVKDVMKRILENLEWVVPHDAANIMLVEGDQVRIRYWKGYPDSYNNFLSHFSRTLAEFNSIGNVLETGRAFHISDTSQEAYWVHVPETDWVRSFACAPIKVEGEAIGFINIDSGTPYAVTAEHAEQLEAFADQAAIAIRNARLIEALRDHTTELQKEVARREQIENRLARRNTLLETLNELARDAFTNLEVGEILDTVARLSAQAVDATSAYVCDWKESENITTVIAEYYMPAANDDERQSDLGMSYNLLTDFDDAATWIRAPQGYAIQSVDDPDVPEVEKAHLRAFGGYITICVPFFVQGEPIGYIEVWDSRTGRVFSRTDIEVLLAIARQVAVTIEQARLHAALKESQAYNQAIIDAFPDIFFRLDADGTYLDARILPGSSISAERIVGKSVFDTMPKEIATQALDAIQTTLQSQRIQIFEYRLPQPDGSERDFEARLVVSGQQEVLALIRDITERKEFITGLAEARDRALEASRIKSQFLANMSHELRTPLNSIINYTQLLLDGIYGDMTPIQLDRMERIVRNGKSLLALINDVLDLSKIETGHLSLRPRRVATGKFLESLMEFFRPMATERALQLDYEATALPDIVVDENRARQVLTNLVSNALKFTHEGGIRLSATTEGDFVQITVQDTGIGIPAEAHTRIFDEFSQVDNSSTRQYEGTGLGLTISKRIVEMHGGRIWFESVEGDGTIFHVTFPVFHADGEG